MVLSRKNKKCPRYRGLYMWDTALSHFFNRMAHSLSKMTIISCRFLQFCKCICRNCLMQLLPRPECITMAARPQSYSHSSEPEPGLILQPLRAGDVTQHGLQHWCPSQTRLYAAILFTGNNPESMFWANL